MSSIGRDSVKYCTFTANDHFVAVLFFELVNANITNASTPVPTASAKNAVPVEIGELRNTKP